ncbi:hypothetical protein ACFLUH_03870 [Chloroflexota bacterium]
MTVSRFDMPEVLKFAGRLHAAQRPSELRLAEEVLGRASSGIDAMVSLPLYEDAPYFSQFIVPLSFQEYVVPFLCHPYVHFVNNEQPVRQLPNVGYTLILDTNFTGYINRFIKERSYQSLKREIISCIDTILYQDLNVDFTLYLLENINKAHPIAEAIKHCRTQLTCQFWESLDQDFKHNIINLELLSNVDCHHYRKTRELRFNISIEDAVSKSVDSTYRFYTSDESQELISDFHLSQQAVLLQLLAILRIQLSSGGEPKDKLEEFLDFVQDKGVYSDRETIVAYSYFKDRQTIPLLNRISRGDIQVHWLDKIENLAWNMTVPRLMERMTAVEGEHDYMVPLFLTFDRKLSELIKCYPVKAVIIDRRSGGVLSIPELNTIDYFRREGCFDMASEFFSVEKVKERNSGRVPTLETISEQIHTEFKEINVILNSKT